MPAATRRKTFRIATRQSPLALWQAEHIKATLRAQHTGLQFELLPLTTKGDKILDTPLAKVGGKGLFVKELEQALLDGRADLAVHSMKDLPMELPAGLVLQAICEREDPQDALVANSFKALSDLPSGARVGTSSLRRSCQLRAHRPDLNIKDLRGNVQTRLAKLDAGEYDAIVLAVAGLRRLELAERITETLPSALCLPAAGQGALGIEVRSDDQELAELLLPLAHAQTRDCVLAERALNRGLDGGCQVPIAAHATIKGDELTLHARVGSVDGATILEQQGSARRDQAEELGSELAAALLADGADKILASLIQPE